MRVRLWLVLMDDLSKDKAEGVRRIEK